jgi:pimeloyl-ACP methyl ester carboxylesterase
MHDQPERRSEAAMSLLEVNGTTLYYEVRGQGPPFLMIAAAVGDSGYYAPVAEALADEFTVVTYDRRGHSRSPRPEHWRRTSQQEQADDAAGLLQALDLAPAAAFGLSASGEILTDLVLRRPEVADRRGLPRTGLPAHDVGPGTRWVRSSAPASTPAWRGEVVRRRWSRSCGWCAMTRSSTAWTRPCWTAA